MSSSFSITETVFLRVNLALNDLQNERYLESAEDVILRFIGDKSETPVNLSAEIETGIFRAFEIGEIKSSLFDAAQDAIRDQFTSFEVIFECIYGSLLNFFWINITWLK